MYCLFLTLAVAAVILSPIALEFWLTWHENRLVRRRHRRSMPKARTSPMAWASSRLHS